MQPSETPSRTHDLFVSYAHVDDRDEHRGKVTALVEAVRADYRRVAGVELNVFFDVGEIRSMDDWEVRILRGLRHSKMMVAVLSPAYFASDYCRKEWQIYRETELAHALPGEGIAPIYVLRHPDFPKGATDERLKQWICDLSKRQYIDWIDFWPEGADALGRADAHRRLEALPGQIADRLRRANMRDAAPNTVPQPSTHFVGRRDELHTVRKQLVSNHVGAITALHGIPGIGKTMLAFAYAWGYGYEYPGGRFLVKAAGLVDLAAGVIALAEPLGWVLGDEERNRPDVVLGKIKTKLENGPAALLVLDNVDDPALLEPQSRERALPRGDHIHVLVTTRVAPERMPRIHCVPLDALEPADALALLQSFRPTADSAEDDEWKAALEVVRRLAGHALALEVVGVFLRENPETSYRAFVASLARDGVGLLDAEVGPEAKGRLEWHAESCVAKLLQPTLMGLSPAERRAVEYAAQLPPDEIPLSWLRALLLKDMPGLQQKGLVDPVAKTFTRLERLRLVVPLTREQGTASALTSGERAVPRLARMHRLVQDIVTAGLSAEDAAERATRIKTLAMGRAEEIRVAWGRGDLDWELPTLRDLALRLLQANDWDGAVLTDRINTPLQHIGRLLDVRLLWQRTIAVEQKRCDAAPENADYARDLSVSCERLGDLHRDLGEPARARDYYERALKTAERLAALAPENTVYARNLTVSYVKLGDLHRALGESGRARDYYERALKTAERLAALAPENIVYARDLSVSCERLGDLHRALGESGRARDYYERALKTAERLAALAPENIVYARDLSVSCERLGDLHRALGESGRARDYYERALKTAERLAALAPENADYARDLSVSCNKLGDLHLALGESGRARDYHERALKTAERLAALAPENADYARDLSVSCNKLGDLHLALGESGRARDYHERALKTAERLAALAPENADYARDLSVSCNKLGDLHLALGESGRARDYYERALKTAERLAALAPENTVYARNLTVSYVKLGDLHRALGESGRARDYYERALKTAERLAALAPENADWQRDLWVYSWRMANVSDELNDGNAKNWWLRTHDVLQAMVNRGLFVSPDDQGFLNQLKEKLFL